VGAACAQALGWALHEGDIHHAPESIAKMRAGIALTEADRAGWLDRLAALLAQDGPNRPSGRGMVLTCSALRRSYRDRLRAAREGVGFVYLALSYDDALARVLARRDHFFSPALVASQFETLEPPQAEPLVLTLDALRPVNALGRDVARWVTEPKAPAGAPCQHAGGRA